MTDKEPNSELNEEECDVIDDYTIGFATFLMQKRRDEVDRMQAEQEIERLKDDYAKLQELFANYQIASDKEMIAQVKQAKIDVLNELRNRLIVYYPSVISEIDELIKEIKK